MPNLAIPLFVVLALPLLWLLHRTGVVRRGRPLAIAFAVAGAGAVAVVASSRAGLDLVHLKRVQLFLAAAAALAALARHLGIGGLARLGAGDDRRYTAWWTALAAASGIVYINFFAFHGERTFVHYPDVAHYYLGSKYVAELGYDDLYVAMLRAEKETFGELSSPEARDLLTNELVPSNELLLTSAPLRARFSDARWEDFTKDVAWFRRSLGPQYSGILRDHGYNPSPAWTLVGGTIASLVPAGSGTGILTLTLLDPLLLILVFIAVGRTYGRIPLLYALTSFFLVFGAGFAWTGGSFLRQIWFTGVVGAACALDKRREGVAGALLGIATALRIFPAVFMTGPVLARLWEAKESRTIPRSLVRLVGGFAATLAVVFALTATLPRGLGHWNEFRADLAVHAGTPAPNLVGLTQVLAWKPGPEEVDLAELRALWERRSTIHRVQSIVLLPLALAAVVLLARGASGAESIALAAPLLFIALIPAAYYWAFLPVFVLAFRDQPRHVALLFAVEAVSYGILLFDERDGPVYILRSLLVLYLFVGVWWRPVCDRLLQLMGARRSHHGGRELLELERGAVAVGTEGADVERSGQA
jgi:hypothetical protein